MTTFPHHTPRPVARLILLTLIAVIGGGVVAFWPHLQQRLAIVRPRMNFQPTPIVSVAEAQRQVPFPIRVPRDLPAGAQLVGVRVSGIRLANPEQVQATLRNNTMPMTGYGLTYRFVGNSIFIHSLQGSPAERSGVPKKEVQLLTVDGHRFSAQEEAAYQRRILQISAYVQSHPKAITQARKEEKPDKNHPHLITIGLSHSKHRQVTVAGVAGGGSPRADRA